MSKRWPAVLMAAALASTVLALAPAATAATSEGPFSQFFMRRDACNGDASDNVRLALEDGDDLNCATLDQMFTDAYRDSGLLDPSTLFPAVEGLPLKLDATRPITGVITVRSYNGAGGGLADLELSLLGETGGEEKILGEYSESYTATPTGRYTFEYEMPPADPSLHKKSFDALTLKVYSGGKTAGIHGVIELNDPPSLINVPTADGDVVLKPEPKSKKKNCNKIKNKKKKAQCKKQQKKKNKGPKAAKCAAFTPGERGAEAETIKVTDAATEESPLEHSVALEASIADWWLPGWVGGPAPGPAAVSAAPFNLQVESKNKDVGLWAMIEFPARRDYDIDLFHTDGSYAARARTFNPVYPDPSGQLSTPGHGGEGTDTSEKLLGIRTAACGGWTMEASNHFGEGGDMVVKLWLGDVVTDPQEPGAEVP